MSDQSSAELELELEAEAARARVADTAENIRKKLTAGQLMDEFSNMITGGDLSTGMSNLKSQVRDNPLPIALVGAGLAWLAFGKGITASMGSNGSSSSMHGAPRASQGHVQPVNYGPDPNDSSSSGVGSAMHSVGDQMSSVGDQVRSAAGSVSGAVSDMTDSLSDTADRLKHSMLSGTSNVSNRVSGTAGKIADQEPLVIAALGVLVGATVGAMFPASELEKEQLGPTAQKLRGTAASMLDKGMDSAGNVASKAYEAMKDEADRQGMGSTDGQSLAAKVGQVVGTAIDTADEAAREEIGTLTGDEDAAANRDSTANRNV